jgi:hypothetical protein
MPKLLEEKEIKLEYTDLSRLVPKYKVSDGTRSSGVHLSGVIKYVMVTCGLLTVDDDTMEILPLRMAVGVAWEAFVVQLWPELVWQPGEVTRDGIIGSPDGINHKCGYQELAGVTILEEVKATWMSRMEPGTRGQTPRSVLSIKRWMLQVAGYCHMMGLKHARLHVLWVNGGYERGGKGGGPQYYTYLIEFTQLELNRLWDNLILPNVGGAVAEQH